MVLKMEILPRVKSSRRRVSSKRLDEAQAAHSFSVACRCGLPAPSARDWWRVKFDDNAELLIATEPLWNCGSCPISSLDRLIRDFDLTIDGDVINAPFPFCATGRYDARRFLNAVLSLSVSGFNPDAVPMGGSC
jgi:hypothetical protein